MYLTQARIQQTGLEFLGRSRGSGEYALHQLVWKMFEGDPDHPRDFLFMYNNPTLMVLSSREPKDVEGFFEMRTKVFEPTLREGQRLGFRTKVNPIERLDTKNRPKVGIFQNARVQAIQKGVAPPPMEDVAWAWFKKIQSACGFNVEALAIEDITTTKFSKKGHKISLETLTASGILTVTNVDAFHKALKEGIGASPAFGCGLLLIRPV